jgi:hypothetical protein
MLVLGEAVLNHMNGELAVGAGQDANRYDRLASQPQAKIPWQSCVNSCRPMPIVDLGNPMF